MRTPNMNAQAACDILINIPEGGMKQFVLPKEYRQSGNSKANKTVVIETSCGVDVAAFNKDTFSSDGFMALPATALGKQ